MGASEGGERASLRGHRRAGRREEGIYRKAPLEDALEDPGREDLISKTVGDVLVR